MLRAHLGLLVVMVGCSTAAPEPEGQADYQRYCGLCHGDNGEGYAVTRANALTNDHFLAAADDAFIRVGIVEGRPGTKMSAWGQAHGGPLTDAQADGIVKWLRSFASLEPFELDESPLQGDVSEGKQLWATHCAGCHGESGQGGSAMSVVHPIFLASASDGFLRVSVAKGRPGTPMPAYEGSLSSEQIDSLVQAIRSMEASP